MKIKYDQLVVMQRHWITVGDYKKTLHEFILSFGERQLRISDELSLLFLNPMEEYIPDSEFTSEVNHG